MTWYPLDLQLRRPLWTNPWRIFHCVAAFVSILDNIETNQWELFYCSLGKSNPSTDSLCISHSLFHWKPTCFNVTHGMCFRYSLIALKTFTKSAGQSTPVLAAFCLLTLNLFIWHWLLLLHVLAKSRHHTMTLLSKYEVKLYHLQCQMQCQCFSYYHWWRVRYSFNRIQSIFLSSYPFFIKPR
jgi:hypothetical protein